MREIVEGHGLNVSSAARVLGVTRQTRQTLSIPMNERGGLSPDMALRIEKAFGVRMDTLLRMQTAWEIAEARARGGVRDRAVLGGVNFRRKCGWRQLSGGERK